ncbi:MAG: DUF6011 domain-containing protein [Propionibacteriaceae bacterium]|jgi:hypothetical protein|nr:DUF6011 domain-containing protein [Propionibacteriaceae bacterium]
MAPASERVVFVDADVLAHPLIRSLLLLSSRYDVCGFVPRWSLAAEAEADRALNKQWSRMAARPVGAVRSRPRSVAQLRQDPVSTDWAAQVIVGPATDGELSAMVDTSPSDRHILAAAHQAGAKVVVSQNVRDFGRADLARLNMLVSHPDVFLSAMLPGPVYRAVLTELAATRSREPKTPAAIWRQIGRTLPKLTSATRDEFPDVEPDPPVNAPAEVFRGSRCLLCQKTLNDPESLAAGIGPECQQKQ